MKTWYTQITRHAHAQYSNIQACTNTLQVTTYNLYMLKSPNSQPKPREWYILPDVRASTRFRLLVPWVLGDGGKKILAVVLCV